MVARQPIRSSGDAAAAVSLDEAVEIVSAAKPPGVPEEIGLSDALGRVLASDLISRCDLPNCDVSAMDGYACRSSDTENARQGAPAGLRLVGEVPAGRPYPGAVGAGEAVAIFTGAPMPEGADAVVRVESTALKGDKVWIQAPARRDDIRTRASQLAQGTTYLRRGTVLSARAVLLAAAMGYGTVPAARRPRVLVVVTGDEVVEPSGDLARGQVFNANGPAVVALVTKAGGRVTEVHHANDEPAALARFLEAHRTDVDLIVTTGGASVGRYDLVHTLLTGDPRGSAAFTRVLVRPGGPVSFGSFAGVPLLALPGNPGAAAIMFQVLGTPWFHAFLGRNDPPPYLARTPARAAGAFRHGKDKTGFWPAVLVPGAADGCPEVAPVAGQAAHGPGELQQARCLAITAPWRGAARGDWIEMMALD